MSVHPRAGLAAAPENLVDLPRLIAAYSEQTPDSAVREQRVAFGTSGHRGSSFKLSFNSAHVLAVVQAVCDYRARVGTTGPLFLGRDTSYPLAMEGALKLKEISYIHAEGYAAGELKHGPIALIDENMPVIVVAPNDDLFEKTVSNMQEVAARGGQIVLISNAEEGAAGCKLASHIQVPTAHEFTNPILYAVPIQLIAYHTAVQMGTDVDQPRNLAKSVTVE